MDLEEAVRIYCAPESLEPARTAARNAAVVGVVDGGPSVDARAVVAALAPALADPREGVAARAVDLLAQVLARAPAWPLGGGGWALLAALAVDWLRAPALFPETLAAAAALAARRADAPPGAELAAAVRPLLRAVASEIVEQGYVPVLSRPARAALLLLLERLADPHAPYAEALRPAHVDVVYNALRSLDGERDPRNLAVAFRLVEHLYARGGPFEAAADAVADEAVDLLRRYFPITVRSGSANAGQDDGVGPRDAPDSPAALAAALARCLTASDEMAPHTVPFLLEKLAHGGPAQRLEALRVLQVAAQRYSLDALVVAQKGGLGAAALAPAIVDAVRLAVADATAPEEVDAALQVLIDLAAALPAPAAEADVLRMFGRLVARITEELLLDARAPNATVASAVLRAVCSANPQVCSALVGAVVPPLLSALADGGLADATARPALLDSIARLLEVANGFAVPQLQHPAAALLADLAKLAYDSALLPTDSAEPCAAVALVQQVLLARAAPPQWPPRLLGLLASMVRPATPADDRAAALACIVAVARAAAGDPDGLGALVGSEVAAPLLREVVALAPAAAAADATTLAAVDAVPGVAAYAPDESLPAPVRGLLCAANAVLALAGEAAAARVLLPAFAARLAAVAGAAAGAAADVVLAARMVEACARGLSDEPDDARAVADAVETAAGAALRLWASPPDTGDAAGAVGLVARLSGALMRLGRRLGASTGLDAAVVGAVTAGTGHVPVAAVLCVPHLDAAALSTGFVDALFAGAEALDRERSADEFVLLAYATAVAAVINARPDLFDAARSGRYLGGALSPSRLQAQVVRGLAVRGDVFAHQRIAAWARQDDRAALPPLVEALLGPGAADGLAVVKPLFRQRVFVTLVAALAERAPHLGTEDQRILSVALEAVPPWVVRAHRDRVVPVLLGGLRHDDAAVAAACLANLVQLADVTAEGDPSAAQHSPVPLISDVFLSGALVLCARADAPLRARVLALTALADAARSPALQRAPPDAVLHAKRLVLSGLIRGNFLDDAHRAVRTAAARCSNWWHLVK